MRASASSPLRRLGRHLLAGLACLAMFACGAVRATPQVSPSHSADRSRQGRVPFTLTLEAALRSGLEAGSAARAGQLDRQQQQALWVFAQAEFSPSFSVSSEARRQWSRGVAGPSDEANMTAGTLWKLPSGAQIDLRLIQDLARTAGTTTRPVTRVLELVQPLLKGAWSAARLGLEQARLTEQIGTYQYGQALDDVFTLVSLAYFDAALARQQVVLAQRALERVQQAKAVNEALHQAGRLAQVELLQSETDLAQAGLDLEQARNAALAAASALLQLLGPDLAGRAPDDLVLPEAPLPVAGPVPAEPEALAQAQAQRSDLRLAEAAVAAARVGVAQAENEGRSTLDLALRVQSQSSAADTGENGGSLPGAAIGGSERSIGLTWVLPLDRSLLRLQRSQSQLDLRRAELALEDAQRQLRRDVADALRELGFAQRQWTLAGATVDLNRRKLDAETERFRAGKTSGFQLSAAQDALRAAESAQAQAGLAVQRAQIQQARALGLLAGRRQGLMQHAEPDPAALPRTPP
jgi:outer membrane protein TolC